MSWPGPIHEGNGTRQAIIDEQTTEEQRTALIALISGTQGGGAFEIFAAVCPNQRETLFAPITFQSDRERRQGRFHIPGLAEFRAEPIKTRVTGQEHRARIVLPGGFEFEEAEMANAVSLKVEAGSPLTFEYANTYAQLNAFDWSNA
jgi:hypothetical protein